MSETPHLRGKNSMTGWESTRGEGSRTAKLTDDDVREIRASSLSNEKLAKRYDVCRQQISKIKKRKAWGHVN